MCIPGFLYKKFTAALFVHGQNWKISEPQQGGGGFHPDHGTARTGYSDAVKNQMADKH